ncbi:bifunctional hydroxymethylpyrimidine kinase/phosphomethylpyrimidine kinase [Bacillus spongiae]|uniref:Hydroxymethylpyrimidine/phosphomethylpyrimidine kinase n=1 Tax=Bacillus spongiae TaxID=2683610 RepID=A0ABU8HHS8_9BACI
MKTALTIAGSDSGGGAGIQADLKTFSALGVFGMSVITAVTAQNTQEVRSVENISLNVIKDQINAIFDDIHVDAVKIGMLSTAEIIEAVTTEISKRKIKSVVVDPVMVSTSGHSLLDPAAVHMLKKKLLPLATVVTPNIAEAEVLVNQKIRNKVEMEEACQRIHEMGPGTVLLKGGHLHGDADDLFYDGKAFRWFQAERIQTKNTHGTGCTLSSAIASYCANGERLETAIAKGKDYVTEAIKQSFSIGKGNGPTHHFHPFYTR